MKGTNARDTRNEEVTNYDCDGICSCLEDIDSRILWGIVGGCLFIGLLLMCILVPLTYNYVEIYKFGILKNSLENKFMYEEGVHTPGRYTTGLFALSLRASTCT